MEASVNSEMAYYSIRSDEGQTLETLTFQIFDGGNSTFIHSFDKTKFLCFMLLKISANLYGFDRVRQIQWNLK